MTNHLSEYARLIRTQKIYYLPTCLILESMIAVYGYIVRIPTSRRTLEKERSRIVKVLEILHNDLVCTLEVFESGQMGFFSGDWKTNRIKAQRIFTHLMDKLEKLHYFVWGPYLANLEDLMRSLDETWTKLCLLLDERCGSQEHDKGDDSTRYFHSSDIESWQKTMANIILDLSAKTQIGDEEYLLLICCTKIKARLLKQIEQMQAKRGEPNIFNDNCILCVSDKDINSTCPHCARFSDEVLISSKSGRHDTTTSIPLHPAYQAALMREASDSKEEGHTSSSLHGMARE